MFNGFHSHWQDFKYKFRYAMLQEQEVKKLWKHSFLMEEAYLPISG